MKIWHVGASPTPFEVNGVCRTVWLLASAQAQLGHDVSLVFDDPPHPITSENARAAGVNLVHVDSNLSNYSREIGKILHREKPDIVHMHSVFILRQASLGRALQRRRIPYVITPHGGLLPQVFQRGTVKKVVYSWLRERPRFMGASAVAVVVPGEEQDVRAFLRNYHNQIVWMPNPVEIDQLDTHRWQGIGERKKIVFLGRFDVQQKGIDVFLEVARQLPEFDFHLYGTHDWRTRNQLQELMKGMSHNVSFHDPVFGEEKSRIIAEAAMYLQCSRWEGFPVSVAEAMYLGTPSIITDVLHIAPLFEEHNLGLVIPLEPIKAAEMIRQAMQDEDQLNQWSRRGREFAIEHFHPTAVAEKHVKLYEESIGSNVARPTNGMLRPSLSRKISKRRTSLEVTLTQD
jgi:glycosyltransferase involved in cell wall biosynthesis